MTAAARPGRLARSGLSLTKYPPVKPSAEKSAQMRAVRTRHTAPERALAKALRLLRLYPSRHLPYVVGKPDFVWLRRRVAVFVDGDFWHGRLGVPKTNSEWWRRKFQLTRERDARQTTALEEDGWIVLRVWESEVGDGLVVACLIALVLSCRSK